MEMGDIIQKNGEKRRKKADFIPFCGEESTFKVDKLEKYAIIKYKRVFTEL